MREKIEEILTDSNKEYKGKQRNLFNDLNLSNVQNDNYNGIFMTILRHLLPVLRETTSYFFIPLIGTMGTM